MRTLQKNVSTRCRGAIYGDRRNMPVRINPPLQKTSPSRCRVAIYGDRRNMPVRMNPPLQKTSPSRCRGTIYGDRRNMPVRMNPPLQKTSPSRCRVAIYGDRKCMHQAGHPLLRVLFLKAWINTPPSNHPPSAGPTRQTAPAVRPHHNALGAAHRLFHRHLLPPSVPAACSVSGLKPFSTRSSSGSH